ncbi:helix-turn-helix domain-containing protein [Spongiactinospora sp. 9N601]|uniref:helix-turn-helix domain-containing protein n=1 Tax=Spongiactinospora sp. 9N601 TaxID=3375149 RepID=UPI003792230F
MPFKYRERFTLARQFSGARLRDRRRFARLSAHALGLAAHCTPDAIFRFERGHCAPSADRLGRLADALSCRIDDLFEAAG